MTSKASTKKSDTVHSIEETEKTKAINCWICHGNHRRDMCTADKNSLPCGKCGLTGHVTEACRGGRRQARTPSRSSAWSGRSTSSSSESSSSSEEEEKEEEKEEGEKRIQREDEKQKQYAASRIVSRHEFRWQQINFTRQTQSWQNPKNQEKDQRHSEQFGRM